MNVFYISQVIPMRRTGLKNPADKCLTKVFLYIRFLPEQDTAHLRPLCRCSGLPRGPFHPFPDYLLLVVNLFVPTAVTRTGSESPDRSRCSPVVQFPGVISSPRPEETNPGSRKQEQISKKRKGFLPHCSYPEWPGFFSGW
jgi:hypothetical protein